MSNKTLSKMVDNWSCFNQVPERSRILT